MVVSNTDNKKIGYGELTQGKQLLMQVSDNAKVIAATDWKIAGKTIPKINERSFISMVAKQGSKSVATKEEKKGRVGKG